MYFSDLDTRPNYASHVQLAYFYLRDNVNEDTDLVSQYELASRKPSAKLAARV